jgi:hypothetical protein
MAEPAAPAPPPAATGAGRRRTAIALVVVASLLAFPAILALWVNRQLLDTENWTRTSTQMLENRVIRDQVSVFIVDQLYSNVDVEGEISQALPPRLKPLAGPAAGALRTQVQKLANKALARPRFQERWANANRLAHTALLKALEGGGTVVSTDNGVVVLDLRSLLGEFVDTVGVGGRIQAALPAGAGKVTILRSQQLDTAQNALRWLRALPIILVVLSLALFGAALAVAPQWRRKALRAYGFGFVVAGIAALVTRSLAGDQVVQALGTTAAVQPAIAAAWTIATPLLVQAATATIGYGVLMIAGAWLAGPTRPAVATRRAIAPYVRSPAIAYGVLTVILLLVLWWAPTPALRNPATALVLIAIVLAGAELLRRQIGREFPDAQQRLSLEGVRGGLGRAYERMRVGAAGGRSAIGGATARVTGAVGRGGGGAPTPPADARIEQLERLGSLREAGVLDAEEFQAQKRRILAEPEPEDNGAKADSDSEGLEKAAP